METQNCKIFMDDYTTKSLVVYGEDTKRYIGEL